MRYQLIRNKPTKNVGLAPKPSQCFCLCTLYPPGDDVYHCLSMACFTYKNSRSKPLLARHLCVSRERRDENSYNHHFPLPFQHARDQEWALFLQHESWVSRKLSKGREEKRFLPVSNTAWPFHNLCKYELKNSGLKSMFLDVPGPQMSSLHFLTETCSLHEMPLSSFFTTSAARPWGKLQTFRHDHP